MPASNEPNLGQFVPGFDFLQGLARNASSALPGLSQWIAPTLDPDEIEKRIAELRTVQFWLEQNARLLATTIQALEVQRMTLATLKSMNVPVSSLHDSLRARPSSDSSTAARQKAAPASDTAASIVDPMQWWGALTQQFTDLATSTMQDALKDSDKARAKSSASGADSPPPEDHEDAPRQTAATGNRRPEGKTPDRPARRRDRSNGPSSP